MFKASSAAVIAALALALAACNTVQGAGEDIESAADRVDREL